MKIGHQNYRIGSKRLDIWVLERSRIGRRSMGSDKPGVIRMNRSLRGGGTEHM